MRLRPDGAQHRLDVLQCRCREIVLFGDCTQHSTGIHGAKFSQAELPDAIAKVIEPDFVMALAGAGSTLLLGPRQVSSFDEGDEIMDTAVADGIIPGGVVLVGHNGRVNKKSVRTR